MSQETKACSLTEDEISSLISYHCRLTDMAMHSEHIDIDDHIERINYLHRRLKATKRPEADQVTAQTETKQPEQTGWGNNG